MMRFVRVLVAVAFTVVSVIFVKYYIEEIRSKDETYPVITVEGDVIEVKTNGSRKNFLKGVSAYDEKDGDLSDRVVVESISRFFEKGVCKITYAVCDSDNHVATATRKIKYKDYSSPKFTLARPLLFGLGERVYLSAIVGAEDKIDGDITGSVIVTSSDYKSGQIGIFHVDMKVSNSKGDIATLRVPMKVEEFENGAPLITLKDYIVYTKVGKKPNFEKYIDEVTDMAGNEIPVSNVQIDSEVKYKDEGAYSVYYSVTDKNGIRGTTMLTVVVES